MPFLINLRTIGIIPHSQIGKIMPIKHANNIAKNGFLGIIRVIVFSETNICRSEEINTPSKMNGNASRMILINIVLKLCILELLIQVISGTIERNLHDSF
jgi:hypothetical protein